MKFQLICLSLSFTTLLLSCGADDSVSCVNCSNEQTLNFVVCDESNGNASVNGVDTGQPYDIYMANLQEQEDTTCN